VTCGVSRDGRRRETTRADATVASPLVSYPPAILGRCSSAATSPWCVVLRSVMLAAILCGRNASHGDLEHHAWQVMCSCQRMQLLRNASKVTHCKAELEPHTDACCESKQHNHDTGYNSCARVCIKPTALDHLICWDHYL
jgi:hypothetical protein